MSRKISIIIIAAAVILLSGTRYTSAAFAATVTIEVGADTPAVSVGHAHNVTARVLLKPSGGSSESRPPIAAALVIDKSGSMQGEGKIENARRGAIEALKLLGAGDIAAVIAYDTEAFVLAGARKASETAYFVKNISRLEAGGNTALYDGVRLGAREIERFLESGYVPRIILLSDGLANVGPSSVWELASLGRSLSKRGITITTIGLGLDYDEDLMTALAAESGGNAYFARTRDRLEDIFRRDMEDAVAITGRDVRITLSCEEGVRPICSVGREGKSDAKGIMVDIDNLYGGEKYAIFEIEVPASEA
ncbi:MAG: VWA domain-containing protein, partial [Synergistaceae bacterium]|nr:VWA domain-containing protein [Synergistaceae bacterium]